MSVSSGIRAGSIFVRMALKSEEAIRGLNVVRAELKAFGSSLEDVSKKTMLAGTAIFAPFAAGVKAFSDFESQMAKVSTMLDNPARYMAAFSEGIEKMAVKFGESTDSLAKGLYDILSASIAPEKALYVLNVSAKAAKAGLTDTGVAADAITTLLNAYGLSAEKAGDVSDWMFQVVKRGKTTFAELAPAVGMVATTCSTAGIGLDEFGAALATMTRNGVNTDNAITALSAIITSFLSPVKEGADYARALGFEMSSATLKSEGLLGVFRKISKLSPDEISTLFPNVRALRGALPALQNMGGFIADINVMKTRAGTTAEAYDKMAKLLSTSFARLKQAGISVFTAIGEIMSKPLVKALNTILSYVSAAREWIVENKRLVLTLAAMAGSVLAAGAALAAIAITVKTVSAALAILSMAWGGVMAVFAAGAAVISAILSPVGLIVIAVTALGAAILYFTGLGGAALAWLGEKFGVLKDFALKTWRAISDAMISGDFSLAAKILWAALNAVWQAGVYQLKTYWADFSAWYQRTTIKIFYGTVSIITDAWAGLETAWTDTVSFLLDIWNIFLNELKSAWNASQAFLQKGWLSFMGMFDKSIDVKAAYKLVDKEMNQKNTESRDRLNAALSESSAKANKSNAATEAVRREAQDLLAGELAGELAQIGSGSAAAARQAREALEKARQEYNDAVTRAETSKTHSARGKKVGDVKNQIGGSAGAINKVADVTGSFNPYVARFMAWGGVGQGGAAERTAAATEEISKNTQKTNKLLEKNSGLVFQ